jgi:hypothetical protein
MVAEFMGWLNAAVKAWFSATFVAPLAGTVEVIVGAGADSVVKLHA